MEGPVSPMEQSTGVPARCLILAVCASTLWKVSGDIGGMGREQSGGVEGSGGWYAVC